MARGKHAKNRTLEGPDDLDGKYADFGGLWDRELKNKVPAVDQDIESMGSYLHFNN